MKNSQLRGLGYAAFLAFVIVSYQNCKSFETVDAPEPTPVVEDVVNEDKEEEVTTDNTPKTVTKADLAPNLVSDCLSNSDYNACIFWRNPVAQIGAPLATPVDAATDLSAIQTHAVNLEGLDESGTLRNEFIRVRAYNQIGALVPMSTEDGFKFGYANDPDHKLDQVMAYYWLNLQKEYMNEFTGAFYVGDQQIEVIAYDGTVNNAFWDPVRSEITMGSTPTGNDYALSADIYAHEMGHGNLTYASNFNIHFTQGGPQGTCTGGQGVCCTAITGCAGAINEGQADYHAQILFPESQGLGETLVNDPDGFSECGLLRGPLQNIDTTAQQAFDACGVNSEGQIHVMGRVYSSVWWQVRTMAETAFPGEGADEVDKLFTDHLAVLVGTDDYVSALDKILATDIALYNTKYSQMFVDEFARRGITQ